MDPIVTIAFVILLKKHTVWKIAKIPLPTYDYKQLSLSEIYVPIPKTLVHNAYVFGYVSYEFNPQGYYLHWCASL